MNLVTVCRNEIFRNLGLTRWWVFSTLTVLLFAASAFTFFGDYSRHTSEYERARNDLRQTFESLEAPAQLRVLELQLVKRIEPGLVVDFGEEKQIPGGVRFTMVEQSPTLVFAREKNIFYLFPRFIDWVFIVTFCLSLSALLIAHDSISGELEDGTLKLSLVHPLSRGSLLAGKLSGMLFSVALPLFLGVALNLLVLILLGISIGRHDLFVLLLSVAATITVLGLFLVVGMWISVASRYSSRSLIWVLTVWMSLVFLVPAASRMATALLIPVKTRSGVEKEVRELRNRLFTGGSVTPQQIQKLNRMTQDIRRRYRNSRLRQVQMAEAVSRISPLRLYRDAAGALTNSGFWRQRRFLDAVRTYMTQLQSYMARGNIRDASAGSAPAAVDSLLFNEEVPSLSNRTALAFGRMWPLLAAGALLFFGCFVHFSQLELS